MEPSSNSTIDSVSALEKGYPHILKEKDPIYYVSANFFRGDLVALWTKQHGGHESRRTLRIPRELHRWLGEDLTDAIVGEFESHVVCLLQSLLSGELARRKLPDQDIGRLHVLVDYLLHV